MEVAASGCEHDPCSGPGMGVLFDVVCMYTSCTGVPNFIPRSLDDSVASLQLIIFASSKYVLMDFVTLNKQTFVQLFILKPSVDYSVFEPDSSPPVSTIFTFDELFQQLNYTAQRVSRSYAVVLLCVLVQVHVQIRVHVLLCVVILVIYLCTCTYMLYLLVYAYFHVHVYSELLEHVLYMYMYMYIQNG